MTSIIGRGGKISMSELKFLCPECGQKILGDAAYSGIQIACPSCQKNITVPAAASAPAMPPVLAEVAARSASPPPLPTPQTASRTVSSPPAAARRPQQIPDRFSALAIASLLCSVFVPLGSIPGIICGHMAKARMRRDIFLVGEKMATAGLLISYCVLMATLALAGIARLEHRLSRPVMVMRESPDATAAMQARIVDEIVIGGNEEDHELEGQRHSTAANMGKPGRLATYGGSFSYKMTVLPPESMFLNCHYSGDETRGHLFDIAVDNRIIATQSLTAIAPGHFVDMEYKIPASLTRGKTQVTVEFKAHPGMIAGGLFGCQMLKR
jgi:DNA-directed RNA polymerase subunit RPC12/RpoP